MVTFGLCSPKSSPQVQSCGWSECCGAVSRRARGRIGFAHSWGQGHTPGEHCHSGDCAWVRSRQRCQAGPWRPYSGGETHYTTSVCVEDIRVFSSPYQYRFSSPRLLSVYTRWCICIPNMIQDKGHTFTACWEISLVGFGFAFQTVARLYLLKPTLAMTDKTMNLKSNKMFGSDIKNMTLPVFLDWLKTMKAF